MMRTLFLFLVAMLGAGPSAAHEARPLFVEITEDANGGFVVLWRIPPVVPDSNIPDVTLTSCDAAGPPRRMAGQRGVVGQQFYRCPQGLSGATLEVQYPSHNPAISTLVRLSWASGESHSLLVSPEQSVIVLPDPETSSGLARDYTMLGIKHILLGYDHLLFIACLVLISGTFPRVLVTITGFTVAHSITLALAALGLVRVPVPAVEAAIALSIVFLAVEIARGRRDTLAWRYPIAVAASFGLLHGFGFASVLNQIGLPQTEVPVALLFFNVGVEIGQVLFVISLVVLFVLLRRLNVFRGLSDGTAIIPARLNLPIAYVVGPLAAFWMIGRIVAF